VRWLVAPALLMSLAGPAPAAAPDVLSRAAAVREQVAYSGEQVLVAWDGGRAQVAWVHVQHDPAVGTRLVYRTGPDPHGRRVVWQLPDRTVEYEVRSRSGRVYLPHPVRLSARAQLDRLFRNYEVTTTPSHALGRSAVRVRIRPRYPGRPRADLRVDAQTGVILRSDRLSADGRSRELAAFVSFVPRPVGWMRGWRVPEGLRLRSEPALQPATPEQAAARLGRRPPEVALPAGFLPITDYLLDPSGGSVRRLYSDGLATLALSVRPGASTGPPAGSRLLQTGAGPVWLQSAGIRHALYWTSQGWTYTLAGELSPEVLLRVAQRAGIQSPPSGLDRLVDWLLRTIGLESDT